MDDDIPYLLLTPGPLTTSRTVRQSMMTDWCTWDDEYNAITSEIRARLVRLATAADGYTSVLMQGSGSFSVEATLGSVVPRDGKLLLIDNGAYGNRLVQITRRLEIDHLAYQFPDTERVDAEVISETLHRDPRISHIAMVHCETTTGMVNPAGQIGEVAREFGKTFILDAMSSFGGVPMDVDTLGIDYLISSANKCIQGVPGFGFVIARRDKLEATAGAARSLCLDLYDQWKEMENKGGKWRYTSPTHCVRAFLQAMNELDDEGGIAARHERYTANRDALVAGMRKVGFQTLLSDDKLSPIITTFRYPGDPNFSFVSFYQALKKRRFVIYPGKVTDADTFRIGTIGHAFPEDFDQLTTCVAEAVQELGLRLDG